MSDYDVFQDRMRQEIMDAEVAALLTRWHAACPNAESGDRRCC